MENDNKKIMSIVQEDGSIDEVEVVIAFEFKDTKKEYNTWTVDQFNNFIEYMEINCENAAVIITFKLLFWTGMRLGELLALTFGDVDLENKLLDINKTKSAKAVVEAIVFFAKKVGIKTVAEFVSSKEIYETCKELEIDYFQGYWFDEPKNVKDLKKGEILK